MEKITGTLVWYYYVCPREVWLIGHELNAFQENPLIELGRLIHQTSYVDRRKEIEVENVKFDLIRTESGEMVVGEIKKSSKFKKPAMMQLLFYLYKLKKIGVEAKGELLFPKEKKRERVELTPEMEQEIETAIRNIRRILNASVPPPAVKCRFCSKCAYFEFCWS